MQINVYAEELTDEIALVTETADTGRTYHGVRIYLKSAGALHRTGDDDDRSAVTFWLPPSSGGPVPARPWMRDVFTDMAALALSAYEKDSG